MTSAPPVIHVIDDDASFRAAIARLLQASGYNVVLYESADQIRRDLTQSGSAAYCSTCRCRV
jgi:FixJ family two-component response regulator